MRQQQVFENSNLVLRLLFCTVWLCCACGTISAAQNEATADPLRNENRLIRPEPGPLAAKIGTAVQWEENWDEAVRKSRESGKPIFWYVSTVPGTFMDRKKEIDRYMLAGPFSYPAIIELINQKYVPVRGIPNPKLATQYELVPYKFVEPGFLIINPAGEAVTRVDHLTTLHPEWLVRLLGGENAPTKLDESATALEQAWEALRNGAKEFELADPDAADIRAAETWLVKGMFAFRSGDHAGAKRMWERAGEVQPDSPLAWKAAAEAQGIGPFARGFEPYCRLPEAAWQAGLKSVGSAAPLGTYPESELWDRGTRFLLQMQRQDGAIVDSDYDFGGYDSLPNVHVAITSLCGMALLEARQRLPAAAKTELDAAIARAADFVCKEEHLNPNDSDEILWAYAYRARFLAALRRAAFSSETTAVDLQLQTATAKLESIQLKSGGWAHEYANPFVTATALTALHAAKEAGAKIDSEKLEAGLAALQKDRFENGAYPYNSSLRRRSQQQGGDAPDTAPSAGRMAIGELALWSWRRIDQNQLQRAAEISLEGQQYLDVAYKYDNHTSTMAYGGFFFWYDMHARAEMIAQIAAAEVRQQLAEKQREIMLRLPELDGCFVDSHELGRCYGTAMALLSFSVLDSAMKPNSTEEKK